MHGTTPTAPCTTGTITTAHAVKRIVTPNTSPSPVEETGASSIGCAKPTLSQTAQQRGKKVRFCAQSHSHDANQPSLSFLAPLVQPGFAETAQSSVETSGRSRCNLPCSPSGGTQSITPTIRPSRRIYCRGSRMPGKGDTLSTVQAFRWPLSNNPTLRIRFNSTVLLPSMRGCNSSGPTTSQGPSCSVFYSWRAFPDPRQAWGTFFRPVAIQYK